MKPAPFEYARPTTVAEVNALLGEADGEAKVLAGGQSLVPLLNFRLATPRLLVDINRIDDLSGIDRTNGTLRLGALTRLRSLEADPQVRATIPLLSAAAEWVGHVQIRNRGTVGGTLAHADPAAEIPAICLLLDAEVRVAGRRGERTIAVRDLLAGFLTTTLDEDELVVELRVPIPSEGERWGFREFAPRRGDFALAGAAATISLDQGGAIQQARIVVFGTAEQPVRPAEAEAALRGRRPSEDLLAGAATLAAESAGADDPRPDAQYRKSLTRALVHRALDDAVGEGARA